MVDVLIERARNIRTRAEEEPQIASHTDAYVCIKCGQEVVLIAPFSDKYGTHYQQHFRHRPHSEVLDCEWRTDEEVAEIREAALKEFSDEIGTRRLRLFLEQEPFDEKFGLFAEIRALTLDELSIIRAATGGTPVSHIRLNCEGALRQPAPREILPSAGVLRIPLDPNAKGFTLTVDAPGEFDLKGVWTASGLGTQAVFLGQENSAEYVSNPQYLAEGETLFLLTPRKDVPPEGSSTVRLAQRTLTKVVVARSIEEWLKTHVKSLKAIATNPLRVSVLLPFLHDPRAERLVRAEAGARCVLAVTPPENRDPTLEVIAWTGRAYEHTTVTATGAGNPRFIEFRGGNRPAHILVHWPGYRGRDVRLQFVPTEGKLIDQRAAVPDFGVQAEDGTRALAEFGETLPLKPIWTGDVDYPIRAPTVRLLGFTELEVRLHAVYPDPSGGPRHSDEGFVRGDDIPSRVNGIFESGARRVTIDFDTMGKVNVDFDYFFTERVKREAREAAAKEAFRRLREAANQAPPPRAIDRPPQPAGPDPLAALEESIRSKHHAGRGGDAPEPTSEAPSKTDPDRYTRLTTESQLERKLRALRPYPPKATREFAAKFLGRSITKETIPEIDAWRNPLNRYIRNHRDDIRSPAIQPAGPPAHGEKSDRKKHHGLRRGTTANSPVPDSHHLELEFGATMPGESPAEELIRMRDLLAKVQARIAELDARATPDQSEPSSRAPLPKSKRAALRAARERAVPILPGTQDAPQSNDESGQEIGPERAHKMMRELPKRLAAVKDDLPEQVSAEFIALIYGCAVELATAFVARYRGRIEAALFRERRQRDA